MCYAHQARLLIPESPELELHHNLSRHKSPWLNELMDQSDDVHLSTHGSRATCLYHTDVYRRVLAKFWLKKEI